MKELGKGYSRMLRLLKSQEGDSDEESGGFVAKKMLDFDKVRVKKRLNASTSMRDDLDGTK